MNPPKVDCDRQHPNLTVADIAAAVAFYTEKLGFTLSFTWGEPPQMAGVMLDQVQVFLNRGTPNSQGSSVYFPVGDADDLHEFHEPAHARPAPLDPAARAQARDRLRLARQLPVRRGGKVSDSVARR
jgi:catechol 2,3-dioxygenase-like lactoylglutathione lyase family enzyme